MTATADVPAASSHITPRDLTVREAAAALRVSERTVARWAATGHIRAWRGGRAWRIPRSEITRIKSGAE